ncbi:MAG: 2-oxo acid dehydrogenase subunit E2 [Limisphaerales bacterium]
MDIKLPKLGEGAESGVVVSILVQVGDSISEGQTILELENEKAVAPIPASAAGTVNAILVKEGDRVSVGATLVRLGGGSAAETPAPAPAEEPAAQPKSTAAKATSKSRPAPPAPPARPSAGEEVEELPQKSETPIAAAPAIRRLAKELGIDLHRVRGTQRGGRIGMEDIRTYIELLQRIAFQRKEASAAKPGPALPPAESIDFSQWGPVERKPLSVLRKTISQRMTESWLATPRVTQFDDADLTRLNDLRKSHAKAYEAKGTRLTMTPIILRAVVQTLQKHPLFNSSLDEATQELVLKNYFHLGLAVDTDAGLIVPVIRDVDKKSVFQLCQDVEALAAKARDRKIGLEDLKGGSFTISNQGGIGGAHFTPIVNRPEVAILGLGRAALKPAVHENAIVPRLLMPMALSYDHRAIDGGSAARFMVDLVQSIQQFPEEALKL